MATRKPPWKKPAPPRQGGSAHLNDAQKAAARQRADAHGRRYPNLVDNMWAVRQPRDDDQA